MSNENRLSDYDWNRVYRGIYEAEKRRDEAVKRALPVGCTCEIEHGSNKREVEVVQNDGWGGRIQVVGVTGRPYYVEAYRVVGIGDKVRYS